MKESFEKFVPCPLAAIRKCQVCEMFSKSKQNLLIAILIVYQEARPGH